MNKHEDEPLPYRLLREFDRRSRHAYRTTVRAVCMAVFELHEHEGALLSDMRSKEFATARNYAYGLISLGCLSRCDDAGRKDQYELTTTGYDVLKGKVAVIRQGGAFHFNYDPFVIESHMPDDFPNKTPLMVAQKVLHPLPVAEPSSLRPLTKEELTGGKAYVKRRPLMAMT